MERKVFANSYERWRATASEKRIYGGNTVTKFLVGFEGTEPSTWVWIVGYGPTPGERKTYAIKKFLEKSQIFPNSENLNNPGKVG